MSLLKWYPSILDYRYSLCSRFEGNVNSKVRCFGMMVFVKNGYALKNLLVVLMRQYSDLQSIFRIQHIVQPTNLVLQCTDTINKTLAIFRISITTDKENKEYQFTQSVSACYVPGTCDQTYNIFQNTKFSIKTCDYTGGFLDSSMYLSNHFVTILVIFIKEKLANLMQWNW